MKLSNLPVDPRHLTNRLRTLASQAGLDRGYSKCFAIGFNKTGTSSIHHVFKTTGMSAIHSTSWNKPGRSVDLFVHQGFSDGTICNFAELDRRFPNSKFILNVRDLDEWLDSRIEHIRSTTLANMHQSRGTWSVDETAIQTWIEKRNRHHLAVIEHFALRPDDLLILNYIGDENAVARLCDFVRRPRISARPFIRPIAKTRTHGKLKNEDLIGRVLQSLMIPEAEWQTDIFCPSLLASAAQSKIPPHSRDLSR